MNTSFRHGSLFSGIGGFDLAAEWMGWENVFHCEWNDFGKKVLNHYWPNSISYHDITKTDFSVHRGTIDILTGGFPCQPYSQAGKRLGKEDERHLWPEMLRAIREIQPTWVVGENVFGLVNWDGCWYSKKCKLTWKLRGTKYSRMYCQLYPSTLPTDGIEFGLLRTPTCEGDAGKRGLGNMTCAEAKEKNRTITLSRQIKDWSKGNLPNLLPTPSAFDWNTAQTQEKYQERKQMQKENGINLHYPLKQMVMDINPTGKTSQLSPQFVLEMMGFPTDWTELPFLNGEQNQSKPEETQ
jgi:hypothetical protein